MNILFFLTPKATCSYLEEDDTMRQALERMEQAGYSALPILRKDGTYCGTLTEGDLLWYIKREGNLTLKNAEDIPILSVERRMDNLPVHVDSNMEDLISKALNQNFVPVIDDNNVFIGIITRKDIIQYYCKITAG